LFVYYYIDLYAIDRTIDCMEISNSTCKIRRCRLGYEVGWSRRQYQFSRRKL